MLSPRRAAVALLALALLACACALTRDSCSYKIRGRRSRFPVAYDPLHIAPGIKTFRINVPDACGAHSATRGLAVHACDADKRPAVTISADLSRVTVTRRGALNAVGYVHLTAYCALAAHTAHTAHTVRHGVYVALAQPLDD